MIVVGLVLLAVVYAVVRHRANRGRMLAGFVVVWLLVCAADLMVGVTHGYSFGEELVIHLLIFAVPAIGARVLAAPVWSRRDG